MVYRFNRLYVGFFLCLTLIISFLYKLDNYLIFLIALASIFDLWKSKFLSTFNIFLLFLVSIFLTLVYYFDLNLFLFLNFSLFLIILLSILYKSYVIYIFPLIIIIFLYFLFNLSIIDRNILYLCFLFSFFNDTTAYIFGNLFKGPLIIPSISPKKTWSGTLISSFLSLILILALDYNFLFSLICSISFFIGDVYFSYIKRLFNLKDFSNLLVSHGGILDRLDSIFLIVIFFNIYLYF